MVGTEKKCGLVIHPVLQKRPGAKEMVDYGPISPSRDAAIESLVFLEHHTSLPVNLSLLLFVGIVHTQRHLHKKAMRDVIFPLP